ncbi:MAG TPA: ferrous iron transport protein A [Candidatus Merdisoma merdipullorum]|uniref:Ferrous iron transport protein A n=1 Tax=Candidatus Enterocloster excrementipullorum TaxID=2838559 RepID=A0A9D2SH25_9FIRM|nr:ferrous iron transport protein A [Candidatus Merdisoma merdipullorum]HJC05122.1 ferrous iron transport protein A [Candidatus Enterocloster excrementipullorum]
MESLSNARRGETCTIKWMFGSPVHLAWMDELHMRPGSQVTVIQNTMGSLIVGVDGRRLAVSRDAADQIKY